MRFASWKTWAVGSVAALTLMAGGAMATGSVSAASVLPVAGDERGGPPERAYGLGLEDRGFGRTGAPLAVEEDLLAEALGITVEELETAQDAAQTRAHEEALAQAVAGGELTQEQADAMQELGGLWGDGRFGVGRPVGDGVFSWGAGPGFEEQNTYLAEELGITVEELAAARETARQADIAQQVEEGTLSQEQADEMEAELQLRDYLGDELENAWTAAIEKSVADGVLTQEQADQIQEDLRGYGGRGTFGRFPGGMVDEFDGGRGMRGGMRDDFQGGRGMSGRAQGNMQGDFDGGRGMRGWPQDGMDDSNVAPDTQSEIEPETDSGSTL